LNLFFRRARATWSRLLVCEWSFITVSAIARAVTDPLSGRHGRESCFNGPMLGSPTKRGWGGWRRLRLSSRLCIVYLYRYVGYFGRLGTWCCSTVSTRTDSGCPKNRLFLSSESYPSTDGRLENTSLPRVIPRQRFRPRFKIDFLPQTTVERADHSRFGGDFRAQRRSTARASDHDPCKGRTAPS
jgi:hypothetical protein